ncbi:hypothetical protein B0H66DRAFT_284381 [Apodospora peruviana]|uniref:Alternative oxidase n=1 Tax=Apodospora peruviana TaxID=516989 RepID=A0AAE0M2A3_9PEZI|nr:hypothetical protein B0H66DRAFT_284381 [Apodospora peruviana]
MSSTLMRWIVAAYDSVPRQQPFLSARYESLAQSDSLLSIKTRRRFRVPRCRVIFASYYHLVAALSGVFLLFVVYTRGGGVSSFNAASSASSSNRAAMSKNDFIAAVVRNPVEGLVDLGPIQQKCNETKFQDGLVWQCAPVNGGIGNVVNMVLNCVRYALEAGATTLILPRISIRADNLIDLGTKDQSAEMSYLLDADYFLESWKLACPQMRALVSESGVNASSKADLSPDRVKSFQRRKYLIVDPTGWREAFDEWMVTKEKSVFEHMSKEKPVRVWQNLAFAQWNRLAHSPEFANSFPRLFRHLPQARRLAASALWSLEKKMPGGGRSVVIVADNILLVSPESQSQDSIVNSLGPDRLASAGFFGAHLRVAADAAKAGWPGYEAQAPFYIREAKAQNLTSVYLATGSAENRDRFRQDAATQGLDTHVKEDLLDEEELAELRKLTWDQQALVDFEVLMHSAMFSGFVRSSYSWALALRRGTLLEAGSPEWSKDEHEYRDSLSAIVGRYGSINPEGLWP